MARITGTAGFGEHSDYDAVDFDIDASEVDQRWIPAVTKEVKVLLDDGSVATDPDTGAELTKVEVVTPGRQETLEEGLRNFLGANITLDEVARSGLNSLSFEVSYSMSGSVTIELEDYDLEDFEVDPDDVDERWLRNYFDDVIDEAIREDISYGSYHEVEYDIDSFDVE